MQPRNDLDSYNAAQKDLYLQKLQGLGIRQEDAASFLDKALANHDPTTKIDLQELKDEPHHLGEKVSLVAKRCFGVIKNAPASVFLKISRN